MTDTLPEQVPQGPVRHSRWHRLYHGETTYPFVERRRIGYIISGVAVALAIVSLSTRGLNLGLDFQGGVAWEVPAGDLSQEDVEAVLTDQGLDPAAAKIQSLSGTEGRRWRVQVGDQPPEVTGDVQRAFAEAADVGLEEVSVASVSASWGEEITDKAIRALVAFFVLIAIYISFRFEWRMAIGALVAVAHDVIFSVGVYSIFDFEVTPATVIAFLTILGFSLYDTIVVFDKIHENTKRLAGGRTTFAEIVDLSMNQVLMRSLNTSLAAVLPVLSLLIVGSLALGAVALQDFALALFVGLLIGSYSSIFIATPLLYDLKRREPKYRRVEERRAATTKARPAAVAVDADASAETAVPGPLTVPVRSTGGPAGLGHPPRPRKKTRKR